MSTKKTAQKKHAMYRMEQRTDIRMSKKKYKQLCETTRASLKRNGVVHKQSNRVSLVKVIFENESLIVAYDKQRRTVVTVLPKNSEFYSIYGVDNDSIHGKTQGNETMAIKQV